MTRSIIILTFGTLLSFSIKSQPSEVFALEGIDWKNDSLPALVNVIKDKHCVVLSEPNHGYGSAFDAQACVIKNLIEKSDRKVVLFMEASWINCEMITRLLQEEGVSAIPKTYRYLTSMDLAYWRKTGFWDYICERIAEGRLELQGFDIGGASSEFVKEIYEEARSMSDVMSYFHTQKHKEVIDIIFSTYEGLTPQSTMYSNYFEILFQFVQAVIASYSKELNYLRVEQWKRILDYFLWIYKRSAILEGNKISNLVENDFQDSRFWGIRDSIMAEIFLSKVDRYTNYKIVCKMATMHSGRRIAGLENIMLCCREPGVKSMGEIISERRPGFFYSIAFIAGSGHHAIRDYPWEREESNPILSPTPGSLEESLMKRGGDYYFADLEQPGWRDSVFTMHAIYERFLTSKWSQHFSGVFYIRNMKPLDLLPERRELPVSVVPE